MCLLSREYGNLYWKISILLMSYCSW